MHTTKLGLLKAALEEGGLAAGTRFLNATVEHRYSGIYQLQSGDLICIALSDKTHKVDAAQLVRAPLNTSLTPFRTEGQSEEQRMFQHCVPITDASGVLLGTLCHFDHVRHELPDEEFEFLRTAAREMAAFILPAPGRT